ncbi:hypothetical protein TVAG_327970 [Trichomonas vaginalis G3]|uniref:Uncharacterized protein n=1 Tax=Trichomonas vaginalis (strain ATCC PRA-98 / G3) TaxID=412133 RepID=A2FKX0_TRIV3|nr:hypothetical protein TVAGG3_0311000 [Trichomonas vaginalis G3]EAX94454.1 hypothetical protein TVAG_327970 [Trichomonas vaginalis G3]KAI5528605.1 hypothetical protein TVAGG3_0311000 [Trichomonas vaginalis G3]|eukprot:XP_001307384.1 hypothetical protein [Trichomonas vaginalis G3]
MSKKKDSSQESVKINNDPESDSEEESENVEHSREIDGSSTVKMVPIARIVARGKKKPSESRNKSKNMPRRSKCCRI